MMANGAALCKGKVLGYSLASVYLSGTTIAFTGMEKLTVVAFRIVSCMVAAGLWLFSSPLYADQKEQDLNFQKKIAHLLFPQTNSWVSYSKLPRFPENKMDDYQAEMLWHIIKPNNDPALMENSRCEAAIRLFMNKDNIKNFRTYQSVLSEKYLFYSGSANCREGDMTLIWKNYKKYESVSVKIFSGHILYFDNKNMQKFVSVSPGCCGEDNDRYSMNSLDSGPLPIGVRVPKGLSLPVHIKPHYQPLRFVQPITLRSGPIVDDRYDDVRSRYEETAIYGNVLRRYGAGVQAMELAEVNIPHEGLWVLVQVPAENDSLKTDTPYDVNVGWVKP